MLTVTENALGAQTAGAAEKASMEGLYFRPILVAKVKDLLLRLILNAIPFIPTEKVQHYDEAIDYVSLLTSYLQQIEQAQHGWAATGRLASHAHQKRVTAAAEELLQHIKMLVDADEIAKIERAVNKLLHAGNMYGDDEQVKSLWDEHGFTMEYLINWLVNLQVYLKPSDPNNIN